MLVVVGGVSSSRPKSSGVHLDTRRLILSPLAFGFGMKSRKVILRDFHGIRRVTGQEYVVEGHDGMNRA